MTRCNDHLPQFFNSRTLQHKNSLIPIFLFSSVLKITHIPHEIVNQFVSSDTISFVTITFIESFVVINNNCKYIP